jgi:Tfp pilus assembly protein PilF
MRARVFSATSRNSVLTKAVILLGATQMQRITREQRAKVRTGAAVLILALTALLAGCATGGKPIPEPVVTPVLTEGPSVTRLEDGRDGFIITENPRMTSESRSDFERAVVKMNEGAYAEAADLLEKVIARSPGVTAPYINAAIAYRRLEKLEKAEEYLKEALNLVPMHPVARNEYGLLFRKTGRFAEARAIYEETLTTFPDYHPVRRNLGILCDLYLNDLACALEQYEIYSEAVPDDDHVRLWVADLRIRMGL